MAIATDSAEFAVLWERLAPHTRAWLARCGDYAAFLHADEVGPEHLLCALMDDESSAAHRAVLHAFADPATISEETRAMAAGIAVSGSAASLPFSELGVRALREARAIAARRGDAAVELGHVALASFAQFAPDVRASLDDAGWAGSGEPSPLLESTPRGAHAVLESGPLFRSFTDESKRAMSAAARLARQGSIRAIGPAHLFMAVLQADPDLERASGISSARVRMLLRGHTEDTTPVAAIDLPPDNALVEFVRGVATDADSLALLAHFHAGVTPELAQVLARHKVTPALLARAVGAFAD